MVGAVNAGGTLAAFWEMLVEENAAAKLNLTERILSFFVISVMGSYAGVLRWENRHWCLDFFVDRTGAHDRTKKATVIHENLVCHALLASGRLERRGHYVKLGGNCALDNDKMALGNFPLSQSCQKKCPR
ncbi:hypothetical protein TRVL_08696 [Trypanosoma vivax]|nr:hypothetical protein TRVL_08696 [Trypanosoma vivax]